MTPQEKHLWYDFLRDYRPQFYRQKPMLTYILDFASASDALAHLAQELQDTLAQFKF